MSTPHDLELQLPAGWFELSQEEGRDLERWAGLTAVELAADQPVEVQDALAEHLHVLATDSSRRVPVLAAAWLPSPAGPVAVVLEVWSLLPDPDRPFDVESLARQQQQDSTDVLLPPDVTVVTLPAGPAVRVRRILGGGEPEESMRRAVVEELTHLVLPPGTPGEGLVLTASWSDVAAGEEHAGLVDDLVQTLRVTLD